MTSNVSGTTTVHTACRMLKHENLNSYPTMSLVLTLAAQKPRQISDPDCSDACSTVHHSDAQISIDHNV